MLMLVLISFQGCARAPETVPQQEEIIMKKTVTTADPKAAVDAIYETMPESVTTVLNGYAMEQNYPGMAEITDAYYGRISDPNGGLCDLLIVKPKKGKRDAVRDLMHQYQEKRIREFENYDILGAFEIAGDAVVIDQGEYVILLMLPDNDAVREIIDQYIPL